MYRTELGYGVECAKLSSSVVCNMRYGARVWCAMCGTELGYGAMHCAGLYDQRDTTCSKEELLGVREASMELVARGERIISDVSEVALTLEQVPSSGTHHNQVSSNPISTYHRTRRGTSNPSNYNEELSNYLPPNPIGTYRNELPSNPVGYNNPVGTYSNLVGTYDYQAQTQIAEVCDGIKAAMRGIAAILDAYPP
eukprot:1819029-Rhodomonas_salina.1